MAVGTRFIETVFPSFSLLNLRTKSTSVADKGLSDACNVTFINMLPNAIPKTAFLEGAPWPAIKDSIYSMLTGLGGWTQCVPL